MKSHIVTEVECPTCRFYESAIAEVEALAKDARRERAEYDNHLRVAHPPHNYVPILDHRPATSESAYFVSVVDGRKWGMLAGPYETHIDALDALAAAKARAFEYDVRAIWYGYGTAYTSRESKTVFGHIEPVIGSWRWPEE